METTTMLKVIPSNRNSVHITLWMNMQLFLKHLYDFDENDDINTFTAKLTGKNKGKRRYAEATDYADRVAAVFKSFKNGGVIKA